MSTYYRSPFNSEGCTNNCTPNDVAANAISVNRLCAQYETVINDTRRVFHYTAPASGTLTVHLDTTKSNSLITFSPTPGSGNIVFLLPRPSPGVTFTFVLVSVNALAIMGTVSVTATTDGTTPTTGLPPMPPPVIIFETGGLIAANFVPSSSGIVTFTNLALTTPTARGSSLEVTCASDGVWLANARSINMGITT